jgi:hypothetical protein
VNYFEGHVSVMAKDKAHVDHLARAFGFWTSTLVTDGGDDEAPGLFLTTRDPDEHRLAGRMQEIMLRLRESGVTVTRYKVEWTSVDSKDGDSWCMLGAQH